MLNANGNVSPSTIFKNCFFWKTFPKYSQSKACPYSVACLSAHFPCLGTSLLSDGRGAATCLENAARNRKDPEAASRLPGACGCILKSEVQLFSATTNSPGKMRPQSLTTGKEVQKLTESIPKQEPDSQREGDLEGLPP